MCIFARRILTVVSPDPARMYSFPIYTRFHDNSRSPDSESAPKFVTVTNPRKDKVTISITAVALQSQTPSGFTIDSARTTCIAGSSIAAGRSCKVAIIFAPTASGLASDTLMITGDMTNSGAPIAITGTAR